MVAMSAVIVAVLLGSIAFFQLALASGAPRGDHAFGDRAPTSQGRLPMTYRAMSGVAIPVLLVAGWVVLERAGVTPGEVHRARSSGLCWGRLPLGPLPAL
ncbi:MAG: hypothetical protein GY722_10770 [bacterium]|nr:hypothetical protein [bacterium]